MRDGRRVKMEGFGKDGGLEGAALTRPGPYVLASC